MGGEYKGFDSDPEETWQVTDVSFTFTIRGQATKLTVGKTKETIAYQMVGDAANLPQAERVLSPFFVSRDIGVTISHVFGKEQRATAAVGVFNDWWVRDLPPHDPRSVCDDWSHRQLSDATAVHLLRVAGLELRGAAGTTDAARVRDASYRIRIRSSAESDCRTCRNQVR